MMKKLILPLLLMLSLALSTHAQQSPSTSTVQLAWNPVPGTGVSYTLYWGTNSGQYIASEPAGANAFATVTNLARGQTYYFAATATQAGVTSAYSTEATFTSIAMLPPTGVHVIVVTP